MHRDDANLLCLKVVLAEVEPAALIRVLHVFQERKLAPVKISVQRLLLRTQGREVLHMAAEFAIADLTMDALRFMAATIAQMPIVLSTVFGHGCADESTDPIS